MDFQLGIWTHGYQWPDSPDANYTIAGLTPETMGLLPRRADGAAGRLSEDQRRDIARPTARAACAREAMRSGGPCSRAARCGRKVEIDMHAKGMDGGMIDEALAAGCR